MVVTMVGDTMIRTVTTLAELAIPPPRGPNTPRDQDTESPLIAKVVLRQETAVKAPIKLTPLPALPKLIPPAPRPVMGPPQAAVAVVVAVAVAVAVAAKAAVNVTVQNMA
jgi:hypothetical protein